MTAGKTAQTNMTTLLVAARLETSTKRETHENRALINLMGELCQNEILRKSAKTLRGLVIR